VTNPAVERARHLAVRHPPTAELLTFYAQALDLLPDFAALRHWIAAQGPPALAQCAPDWHPEPACARYLRGEDLDQPDAFLARLWLRQNPPPAPGSSPPGRCPWCGQPPQAGVLRPEGHGRALALVCSLCTREWPHPRGSCPACASGKLESYQSDAFPHISTIACEDCRTYLHLIDLSVDPDAIAEVDELAAAPVDLWLGERGFRKIFLNLAGL
jgi:hypothetical protein